MLVVTPRTLSSSIFLHNRSPNPTTVFKSETKRSSVRVQLHTERGLEFESGDSFFRHESATARDLGVLSASLYKKSNGSLRVLDAMCGCGIRSVRYLVEAEADFVLANDANENYRRVILDNLKRVSGESTDDSGRWLVKHLLANKIMSECYLQADFFDLIDVDSFGSDSDFLRSAFNSLKRGGLLYLTSTDGFSSGGHRPYNSLAAYGAFIQPMPYANEIGLRMLIGGAVREASLLGYHVTPLFSYYSYHGPVFRVLLQVTRGKLVENRNYGFITYCNLCGNSQTFSWDKLRYIGCPCVETKASKSLVVTGPLWIGPLHSSTHLTDMLDLAKEWGWVGEGTGADVDKLLKLMINESDPLLPPGYIKMDEMGRRAKINTPSLVTMMNALDREGYVASRSHIISSALKTNCSMSDFIRIAKELQMSQVF